MAQIDQSTLSSSSLQLEFVSSFSFLYFRKKYLSLCVYMLAAESPQARDEWVHAINGED